MDDTNSQIGGVYVVFGVIFCAMSLVAFAAGDDGPGSRLGAGLSLLAFGVAQIWSGAALRGGSERGRAGVQVIAILYLLSASIFSVLGGVTLWLLYRTKRSHAV